MTLKTAGAAEGTCSPAAPADCEDDCALALTTKIAAKNAQDKMIFLNCFTFNKSLPTTPIAQLTKPIVGLRISRLPHREKFHKHFLEKF
jgi:hypothetical protein